MYDVIISGAGPAGSKCAEVFAKSGFKVALIEKDTNWRKPCGGAVNSRIYKYYPQLRKYNFHRINKINIYSAEYFKFGYRWNKEIDYSINVDRLEFDNVLRNIAIDAGAELFDKNVSYDFIIKNNQRIGVKTKSPSGTQEYEGKIIIIADGMSSKLAIKSGLRNKWKIEEIILAKSAILEGKNNIDIDTISLFFKSFKGYAWLFPLEDKKFNIGIGTMGEDNLKYNLNQIFNEFKNDPKIKQFLPENNYKKIWEGACPLPGLGIAEKSLYGDNMMLIGDAAGFVNPISGEGICPSIASGKVAAETGINALESEDLSQQSLKKYRYNPTIRKISRSYKMTLSLLDFCFEKQGQNFSKMCKIAENDDLYREQVVNMFLFSKAPPKDFITRLKNEN
ncbi:MAG: geranylgeranyl reductase family protein [Candidatus Hermodarchaeota archaeon]